MLEMENGLMVLPKVISNVVCYFLVLFCYSYYGTRVMNLVRIGYIYKIKKKDLGRYVERNITRKEI